MLHTTKDHCCRHLFRPSPTVDCIRMLGVRMYLSGSISASNGEAQTDRGLDSCLVLAQTKPKFGLGLRWARTERASTRVLPSCGWGHASVAEGSQPMRVHAVVEVSFLMRATTTPPTPINCPYPRGSDTPHCKPVLP
jgi:hypothetical protein